MATIFLSTFAAAYVILHVGALVRDLREAYRESVYRQLKAPLGELAALAREEWRDASDRAEAARNHYHHSRAQMFNDAMQKEFESLPVRKLKGVGPKRQKLLAQAGIHTVGGVVASRLERLGAPAGTVSGIMASKQALRAIISASVLERLNHDPGLQTKSEAVGKATLRESSWKQCDDDSSKLLNSCSFGSFVTRREWARGAYERKHLEFVRAEAISLTKRICVGSSQRIEELSSIVQVVFHGLSEVASLYPVKVGAVLQELAAIAAASNVPSESTRAGVSSALGRAPQARSSQGAKATNTTTNSAQIQRKSDVFVPVTVRGQQTAAKPAYASHATAPSNAAGSSRAKPPAQQQKGRSLDINLEKVRTAEKEAEAIAELFGAERQTPSSPPPVVRRATSEAKHAEAQAAEVRAPMIRRPAQETVKPSQRRSLDISPEGVQRARRGHEAAAELLGAEFETPSSPPPIAPDPQTGRAAVIARSSEPPAQIAVPATTPGVDTDSRQQWLAFGRALSADQAQALKLMLRGPAGFDELKTLAKRTCQMPLTLLEAINEVALVQVDDQVIDTSASPPIIEEDYRKELEILLSD